MTESFRERMLAGSKALRITLDAVQVEKLYHFYSLLYEKNREMNLTRIIEEGEVVQKHFLDSLSLAHAFARDRGFRENGKLEEVSLGRKWLDVGSGAGFPGIVLKIAFPGLELCLNDSLGKRVSFLKEAISALELEEIEAVHGRAEELARREDMREKYDVVLSRAVARLNVLSEYCIPFVRKGGCFIAMKSADIEEEGREAGRAIRLLGGVIENKVSFTLPDSDIGRCLVYVKKTKHTTEKYPRRAGIPSKEPL